MPAGGSAPPVLLGLAAAAVWGGSDFSGGIGTRRSPAILVVASGHLVTLAILAAACLVARLPLPLPLQAWYGVLGGLEGAFALAIFYRALAMGAMGLTAALTGLLTAVVPVLFGFWSEGLPRPVALAGLLLGCAAIWLIAHAPERETPHRALALGALAGAGFGLQLILLKAAAAGGVLWAIACARLGGVAGMGMVLLFAWPRDNDGRRVGSGFWKMGVLAGGLDTAGNLFYALASRGGRLDVAATVSSLYPGFTILLAALILGERPSRRQVAGMAVALSSVVLLSL